VGLGIRHGHRTLDRSEERVDRRRYALERQRLRHEPGVAELVAAAAPEEAGELLLEGSPALRGLVLQAAERHELPFAVDQRHDRRDAERADELTLEIGIADVHDIEKPLEVATLRPIDQSDQALARQRRDDPARTFGAADRANLGKGEPQPGAQNLHRDPVTLALDDDERHGIEYARVTGVESAGRSPVVRGIGTVVVWKVVG